MRRLKCKQTRSGNEIKPLRKTITTTKVKVSVRQIDFIIPLLRIFLYFFVYRRRSGISHKNFEMHAYLKGLHFIIKSVKVAGIFHVL